MFSVLPFPKQQILNSFKLQEFADNNFEFYENGMKVLKTEGKHCGKGEVARYEQFLLFSPCFKKTCTANMFWKELI